jgi:LacI family transcriptional regulator
MRMLGRAVTLEDVAAVAGVSTATVSLVVRHRDGVRPETRARVQEVIDRLGYIPNGSARGLSRQRKEIIGLIAEAQQEKQLTLEHRSPLYRDEILYGIEEALRRERWSLLISFMSSSDIDAIQSMLSKVDGLVVVIGTVHQEILNRLAERIPLVVVAGNPATANFDVVAADNAGGLRDLLAHLLDVHQYRTFSYVGGPDYAPDARERLHIFEAVMAEADAEILGRYHGPFTPQSGIAATRQIVDKRLPDVIVCANDQLAGGVISEMHAHGIDVPGDVAVVGFDDLLLAEYSSPPLTTVRQPIRELGKVAATRLLRRIDDPGLPIATKTLPTTVVIRASCGCENQATQPSAG